MRRAAALAFLLFFAACERAEETPAATPVEPVDVAVSDELPIEQPATGIAFWTHPNIVFNGLMIVASPDGLVSYNIEDGNEVSRVPNVNAQGVRVSYLGFGPLAAGVVATYDEDESVFRFYGVDNASRVFLPLEGGPAVRGEVRDFCLGRALTSANPTLFVVQRGAATVYNLSLDDMGDAAPGLAIANPAVIDAPDDIARCAVDADGVLLLASENGAVYRLDGKNGFDAPFARSAAASVGGLAVIPAAGASAQSASGWIALLDETSGIIHLFDRMAGSLIGAVRIAPPTDIAPADDSEDAETPSPASAIGASGANLGGLYRNGAIALGLVAGEPVVRLIPLTGVRNALALPESAPVDLRGTAPAAEDDDRLIIPVELETE